MTVQAFEQMQFLVTGVDAALARDVVRLIASEGGAVVAADKDAAWLGRLERDLELCRTPIETAQIDLVNQAEIRLWLGALSGLGRLPHVMICCCGASPARTPRRKGAANNTQPADVSLSEHPVRNCPGLTAEQILQPTLFLHAQQLRPSTFDRALAVVRQPTLRGLLARSPARGVFNAEGAIAYVRIASHRHLTRRQLDGETTKGGRLRLVHPSDKPPGRANAA